MVGYYHQTSIHYLANDFAVFLSETELDTLRASNKHMTTAGRPQDPPINETIELIQRICNSDILCMQIHTSSEISYQMPYYTESRQIHLRAYSTTTTTRTRTLVSPCKVRRLGYYIPLFNYTHHHHLRLDIYRDPTKGPSRCMSQPRPPALTFQFRVLPSKKPAGADRYFTSCEFK